MRGHEQIVELRQQGLRPSSVFVVMQDPPADKEYLEAVRMGQHPTVYVGDKPAVRQNLAWVKGIKLIHLVPSENIQNSLSWWCALVDAKPSFLITVIDGEMTSWKQ